MRQSHPEKLCLHCGRSFFWRKKWESCWEEVRYCSDRCRSESKRSIHCEYEMAILNLLNERGSGKTICPSEAARAVHGNNEKVWRRAMEAVRCAARRLARQGKIQILRKGSPIDPDAVRGVIRLGHR